MLSEVQFGSGSSTTAGTRPSSSAHTRDSGFRRPAIVLEKVPTAAELAGDESSWPTQIYNPFSTVPDPANPGQYIRQPYSGQPNPCRVLSDSPAMQAYATFVFPTAGPAFDANGDNVLDTTPQTQTINQWTARIDQKIGANDSAWFRYSRDTSVETSSGGLPGIPNVVQVPNRNYGGSYVHVFPHSLILQAQFGRTLVGANSSAIFAKGSASVIGQVAFSPTFAGDYTAIGNSRSLLPQLANQRVFERDRKYIEPSRCSKFESIQWRFDEDMGQSRDPRRRRIH